MSIEGNKQLVRRAYDELWNERRIELADELCTPDFVNHAVAGSPVGTEGLKRIIGVFASAFPDFRYEVEDIVAEGDRVAVRDTFRGRMRVSSWVSRPVASK